MIGFEQLNPMQQKAVMQKDGAVLILAGAGSGKTGALTVRIASMLEHGISPYNILAITFTNKAAKEMRERVDKLAGSAAQDVWISTFHSTCVRILRREIDKIGFSKDFSIYDSDDQEKVMKEVFKVKCSNMEFSLSGVQNKVQQFHEKNGKPEETAGYALRCVAKAVYLATEQALKAYPGLPVVFSGGVASNSLLRDVIAPLKPVFAQPQFSTDNAMGVAVLAHRITEA